MYDNAFKRRKKYISIIDVLTVYYYCFIYYIFVRKYQAQLLL